MDNFVTNPGVGGSTFSADDVGAGVLVQRVKIQFGIDGVATDVSIVDPLPLTVVNFPATQVVSAVALPLPTGAATEAGNLATIAAKDFATQATLALVKAKTDNLDLAVTALRDALRGGSNKTLTDIDTDLATLHTDLTSVLTISDFDSKTGSLTETAPATDTASSGLNGRLQRIAQRITTLIASTIASSVADGSNVVEGALADAIVAAGATGSISAKLRRVTQGLEDLKTTIVLAAGSQVIGKVGIDQTTPGTTNKVTVGADVIHTIVDSGSITANAGTNLNTSGLLKPADTLAAVTSITNVVHVDDNAGSLTVDGAVTANAGTNLNTSALALEGGGNLATLVAKDFATSAKQDTINTSVQAINTKTPSLGLAAVAASIPVTIAYDDQQVARTNQTNDLLRLILVELRAQTTLLHSGLNLKEDITILRNDETNDLSIAV